MTVIPFPPVRGEPPGGPLDWLRTRVPVRGWFATPKPGMGTFMGSLRVLRLARRPTGLWCHGVVAGTLRDGDGSRLGAASQRCQLPVVVQWDGGGRVGIGPVEADLLGLRVHIDPVVLGSSPPGRAGTERAGTQQEPPSQEGRVGRCSGHPPEAGSVGRRVVPLGRWAQ